ncbi:MAG: hypothetical protein U0175_12210 [Caldilineaceae bacterium]
MTENFAATLPLFIQHLKKHLDVDPELRMAVRGLAQSLLELTADPPASENNIAIPSTNNEISLESDDEPTSTLTDASSAKSRSKNGIRGPVISGRPATIRTEPKLITIPEQPIVVDDLLTLAERLRIKAEGARWAAERERLMIENVDYSAIIEPKDREIIFRARQLPDCFLWMCHRDGPTAKNRDDYDTLAGCFDAAADIVLLIDRLEREPEGLQYLPKALAIAAEAQSALRIIVNSLDPRFTSYTDPDQFKLFNWLRNTCRDQQILIHRFMRLDDPADPQNWQDIRNRVVELANQFDNLKKRDKEIQQLFKKIEYRVKRLKPDSKDDPAVHWKAIVEHTEQLIENGLQPSNPELREMLLPHLESIPDIDILESARNFQTVLREIDRYIASVPEETAIEGESLVGLPNVSEGVRQAAELLRGRTVVLIGGDRRNTAAEALKKAFGLKELIWVEGRDQTYVEFEPQVARDDVSLVILAIRWSRHGFGEVKNFCEHYNKPLVRLPGGYNPNQVAFHVLNQVGDRLAVTA